MCAERNDTKGNSSKLALQEEMIEELFRLAEVIHAQGGIENQVSQDDRLEAAKSMAELLKEISFNKPEHFSRVHRHSWVLDVLEDLVNFAENQGLVELEALLKGTQSKAADILRRK